MNKIQKFIEDNNLDFTGSGSALNGNCVIIAGYACYLELSRADLMMMMPSMNSDALKELARVFDFAIDNDYGSWWYDAEAHDDFEFEDKP